MEKVLSESELRLKYASQLKRNNTLNINTAEGWNDSVRAGHSDLLIEKGIEPTEENLLKFQEKIKVILGELEQKHPSSPISIAPESSPMISAEEHLLELEVLEHEKIFMNRSCAYPHKRLFRVYDRMFRKYGDAFGLSAVYLFGYIQGIRDERSKRREKIQTPIAM